MIPGLDWIYKKEKTEGKEVWKIKIFQERILLKTKYEI